MEHEDTYLSVGALASKLRHGRDYRLRILDRDSTVTIIAPHGGFIEPGTSTIAGAIAGRDYNLFDFQGLRKSRPWELHVTSTRFRHTNLEGLLNKSDLAVSVHGMGTVDSWNVWLGGRDMDLRELMERSLEKSGFSVRTNVPKYRGEHRRNVVNLVPGGGLQMELPCDLIASLFDTETVFDTRQSRLKPNQDFDRFVAAIRAAIKTAIEARRVER